MINKIICDLKSITIIDEKFKKTITIPEDYRYSYSNFTLESIYNTYKITKECPFKNILHLLTISRPIHLTEDSIQKTMFYTKHISFFDRYFPNLQQKINYSFTLGETNASTNYWTTTTTSTSTIYGSNTLYTRYLSGR